MLFYAFIDIAGKLVKWGTFFSRTFFFGPHFLNLQFPTKEFHNDVLHQNTKAKTISGRNVRRTVEVETELLRRATSDLLSYLPFESILERIQMMYSVTGNHCCLFLQAEHCQS